MQQTPQVNPGQITREGITLRPHQAEAVDAIVRGLSLPPDGALPAGGLRGQVHMATGTGKTITAAMAAHRLAPHGVIGVLVPTLDLLTQTIEAWRRAGHTGPAIAVCGPGPDTLLEALGARRTTNPTQLALWANTGPMLVFATYASLAGQGLTDDQDDADDETLGVLEQALRGSYGQKMAPFDLLVVDEAHRTSGNAKKAWASIHDQSRFPAARRLYMTATPRLWTAGPRTEEDRTEDDGDATGTDSGAAPAGDALGGQLVASMDDTTLYGPVLHETGLMESVERGILARFEVDVLEIRDPAPIEEDTSMEERRGRRLAALQAALLKHADESGTRSYMTFHSRTLDAMAFARAMPETAARLHHADPAAYPARVGSEWLSGEHPAAHRRDVLTRYADGLDAEGWVTELSFLASCRVLGEGVDIRGTRGVGAVVFADTRSSPVEIVQIIGRALRQDPGEGKVSRIIVPVFLEPGEDPGDMMASSSYRGLVAILQGLRAHDDRVIERMTLPTTTARGQITSVLALDPQAPADNNDDQDDEGGARDGERQPAAAGTGNDDQEDRDDQDDGESEEGTEEAIAAPGTAPVGTTPLLRFSLPRDPQAIALFVRTRVLRPDSEVWLTGYQTLRAFVDEHGHAQVPAAHIVTLADGREYGLGVWTREQRRAFKNGVLRAWRYELLTEVGMVWSVADAAFWRTITTARRAFELYGTLAVPRSLVIDGVRIGQTLSNLRRPGGLGGDPERAAERRAALEAIDPDWAPTWSTDWQRAYTAAHTLLAEEQARTEILPGITVNGIDIGTWTAEQTDPAVWDTLLPEQQTRLQALGLKPRTAPAAAQPPKKTAGTFELGITALAQYAEREGHLRVPRQHTETVVVDGQEHQIKTGVFLSNHKSRRAKLPAAKLGAFAALGCDWAQETTV
ncbi:MULTISPECIES: DEAD/DEAH box helicase [unclassified Streptomyces]|uniref:DEAD/DEAH box helicase n=1 Tax=unclassified Streptomyces TaxID=2593676 RepID=UPI000823A60D|nr:MULTISPECIES: DEAD/DEAH box helicase [unclassified Streptomyces]MYT97339.1 DEAD/DEAH box helicase family protein [Streptomyces sp. SID8350]SCK63046.1 Predicted helicase [Streptomyces sp. AmelKG-D3]